MNNKKYLILIILLIISLLIGLIPQLINFIIFNKKKYNFEKKSSYECGFNTFSNIKLKFNVSFYIIAIIFILFDIETIFFFPWATSLYKLKFKGYISMIFFILEFIIIFLYIYKKKIFNINKKCFLKKKIILKKMKVFF